MNPAMLSIIIVNFETPDYTLQCLRSIYEHPPSCGFEIILIDNGSSDGSLELIRREMPEVICIETGSNLGFARANNLGINNARGEYVLLLNSDTKVLDRSLDDLLGYLVAHPDIGAAGARQLDGEGRLQLAWGDFPNFFSEILRKVMHRRLSLNDLRVRDYLEQRYAGSSEVDWVSGSCFLARRHAFFDAGLFDEHFFMYFEDVDLCRRIKDKGWKIHYKSDTTIVHYGGISAKKNILRVLLEHRRSQLYFTRKYYGRRGVLALKALLLVKYGVYFIRSGIAFVLDRFFGREVAASFAGLLLSKKALELIFKHDPVVS